MLIAGVRALSCSIMPPSESTSASGSFHWKASSRPRHRRHRHPAVGHDAVGGPGRIAPRVHRARHPFARAADRRRARFSSSSAISIGDALGRRDRQRRERRARDREFLRVERGARHRERAFDMAGRLLRQRLDAREPLARGIAGPQMRVGLGEIGMRIGLPGRLDDAGGAAQVAGLAEQPAGERGGRHQRRRELDRFERQRAGAVAVAAPRPRARARSAARRAGADRRRGR